MVGRLLDGRYQIRARIARGGMATVYLATDLRLERRVAVKVMHAHLADDAAFRDRFIQEARSAARLAHPNVVNVFDQGQDLGTAYLVMEYLQGITLRDLLGEYGRLTPEQTTDILEAVLAGLVAAHKAGIIHRDLKPENVLLADDGRIKLGDFGLARAATSSTASGQALLGTIAYLSPELVTRGIADTRSDVYAVGIMMYEMLTGEQPFKGEQPVQIAYQHANDSVPAPSLQNPDVPGPLDDLTLWATSRDPEERPRDARAMLDQLYEMQQQMREDAAPERAAHRRTAPQRTLVAPAVTTRLPTAPAPRGAVTDTVERLRTASARAHRRGAWAFAAVLVAGAASAGTGWIAGTPHDVRVRSLSGLSPAQATKSLIAQGLRHGTTRVDWDSDTAKGAVAATIPAEGTTVQSGSSVIVVVSKGPKTVVVPDVAGMPRDAATSRLRSDGLQLAPDQGRASRRPAGAVVRVLDSDDRRVAPGAAVPAGSTVRLVVSTGPAPAPTPSTATY